ncbi:MAG TPA: ATP-binding protein [Candidatus Tectomicrobia bacterium]|nr:ATP-binding protein [Candidatus Tectomicrobia bacterium]
MTVRDIRLRTKLAFWVVCLVVLLTGVVIIVVEHRERKTIEAQVQKRGMTIAHNLAAVSTNALMTYNYVLLGQHVGRIAGEEDVVYVIILDREGRVAAHSHRNDLQGQHLTDPLSQRALGAMTPLIQAVTADLQQAGEGNILEVAVPVFPTGEPDKWGTVRVGISLQGMYGEIQRTRLTIVTFGIMAALVGCLAALILARRITSPLEKLREGALAVAGGDLTHRIALQSRDEIGELATTFNHMTNDLQVQQAALQAANHELDAQLKEVSKLERYNARILEAMTNGLITLNMDGRIVKWNDMAARITGYHVGEVEGRLCQELFASSPSFVRILLDGIQRQVVCWDRSVSFVRLDGHEVPLEINTSLLEDETGQTTGLLGIFRDLSLVRELEQRLRRADRLAAVGRMAATVAHEIKNPLVALKTFVDMVPRRAKDPAFIARFRDIVPKEVDRVNAIMEDLLDLSRPPRLSPRPLHVEEVIRRCIALHEHQAAERGITLVEELAPDLAQVRADPEYLLRALGNLTINAIQAMSAGGTLTVRSGNREPWQPTPTTKTLQGDLGAANATQPFVWISVTDTGTGMTPEQLDSLFTPFFTTKEKGTGLGLALTHKIIEEHQGYLHVESQFGVGSTFTILLPSYIDS